MESKESKNGKRLAKFYPKNGDGYFITAETSIKQVSITKDISQIPPFIICEGGNYNELVSDFGTPEAVKVPNGGDIKQFFVASGLEKNWELKNKENMGRHCA